MSGPTTGQPPNADATMTDVVALVLLVGVVLSSVILATGLALVVVTGQTGYQQVVTPRMLMVRPSPMVYPHTISDVVQGVREFRPFAIIQLGVVLLIATPVLRVAASVFVFAFEDDRLYSGITLTVLMLLLFSLFVVA